MNGGRGSVRGVVRRKVAVSYVIRDVEEKLNRSGVNKLCIDHTHQLLYTAGRDSIIRSWDISQSTESTEIVSACSENPNSLFELSWTLNFIYICPLFHSLM